MPRFSAATLLSLGLTLLVLSVIQFATFFGLFPDAEQDITRARQQLCESVAIQGSILAQSRDTSKFRVMALDLLERNKDIVSVSLRRQDGRVFAEVGPHQSAWLTAPPSGSTMSHVRVPIHVNNAIWGQAQIVFRPTGTQPIPGINIPNQVQSFIFVGGMGYLAIWLFLRHALKHMDPSSVISERVRTMFNTLSEGIAVINQDGVIVMANGSFARYVGIGTDQAECRKISSLTWVGPHGETSDEIWAALLAAEGARKGVSVRLRTDSEGDKSFTVHSSPIFDVTGRRRGLIASFDDVTLVEKQNAELSEALAQLQQMQAEVARQNQELRQLSMTDPLTGCLNRRAFFAAADDHWRRPKAHGMACIMVDVDHFKSINDKHGHAAGDLVLQHVANILKQAVRTDDLVCRYGGEEFCILLPGATPAQALQVAERCRDMIATTPCAGISLTASFGVCDRAGSMAMPQSLLEFADKAMYESKRSGRNKVTVSRAA